MHDLSFEEIVMTGYLLVMTVFIAIGMVYWAINEWKIWRDEQEPGPLRGQAVTGRPVRPRFPPLR